MPLLDNDLIPLDIYEKIFKEGYRGTFLGGCIMRKEGSNIRPSGHCHFVYNKDKTRRAFAGYICIKSKKPESCITNNQPTSLFLHELGHLIAMNRRGSGYGEGFKLACNELGLYIYGHHKVRQAKFWAKRKKIKK